MKKRCDIALPPPNAVFSCWSTTQTDGPGWWFIDGGPGCTTKRLPLLTPTTTVSSPWNLGMNWSPRTISDWFRGRKRHSTFMLHSAGASAIAQIQGGGCCFLLRGKMLLRLEAIRSGPDLSVGISERWCAQAWSFYLEPAQGMEERSACFYPYGAESETVIYLCAAGRCFRVAVRRAG